MCQEQAQSESFALRDILLGNIHIARAIAAHRYIETVREAFSGQLFGVDGDCYFPTSSDSAFEVIELIRSAGGIPVIAHPALHSHHCGFDEGEIAG